MNNDNDNDKIEPGADGIHHCPTCQEELYPEDPGMGMLLGHCSAHGGFEISSNERVQLKIEEDFKKSRVLTWEGGKESKS